MPIIHMYRCKPSRVKLPSPIHARTLRRAAVPSETHSALAPLARRRAVHSIELQQPLGLVSWWDTLNKDKVFEGQTFGFGIDAHWTSYVGYERHSVRGVPAGGGLEKPASIRVACSLQPFLCGGSDPRPCRHPPPRLAGRCEQRLRFPPVPRGGAQERARRRGGALRLRPLVPHCSGVPCVESSSILRARSGRLADSALPPPSARRPGRGADRPQVPDVPRDCPDEHQEVEVQQQRRVLLPVAAGAQARAGSAASEAACSVLRARPCVGPSSPAERSRPPMRPPPTERLPLCPLRSSPRRPRRVGKGNCEKVCSKVGICLGIVDMADCDQEAALESPNVRAPAQAPPSHPSGLPSRLSTRAAPRWRAGSADRAAPGNAAPAARRRRCQRRRTTAPRRRRRGGRRGRGRRRSAACARRRTGSGATSGTSSATGGRTGGRGRSGCGSSRG